MRHGTERENVFQYSLIPAVTKAENIICDSRLKEKNIYFRSYALQVLE